MFEPRQILEFSLEGTPFWLFSKGNQEEEHPFPGIPTKIDTPNCSLFLEMCSFFDAQVPA